jgi:hypothetical protein
MSALTRLSPTKPGQGCSKKEAQGRCCPGLPFPRLLHANLAYNQSGSAWQDRGDKMAAKLKWAGVAQGTQRE